MPIRMKRRVSITVPIPASKKNRRILNTKGKHPILLPSPDAKQSEKEIRDAWIEAVGRLAPVWDSEEIAVSVTYAVKTQKVTIDVEPLAPRPKGVTGRRRDLHGMIETVCDALEGLAYKNDNQVAVVVMRRVV